VQIDAALEAIAASAGQAQRNYLDTLRVLSTIIEDDLLASDPGTRSRTRYLVLFVAAGPLRRPCRRPGVFPRGSPGQYAVPGCIHGQFLQQHHAQAHDCERLLYGNTVADLRSYVRDKWWQGLILHTFALSSDQRALDVLGDMATAGLGKR